MNQPPKVLVADSISQSGIDERSGATARSRSSSTDRPKRSGARENRIPDFNAVVVRSQTKITAKVLKRGEAKLRVVGRAGVGIDNVDVQPKRPGEGS